MRAVSIDDFGATPAVTEVPKPAPGPGEVLVRVRASSLNGFDGAVIFGVFKNMLEHKFPVVLGKDFAGTVEAVGDGVQRPVGERVFGVMMKPVVSEGSFAEYIVVADGYGIASLPDELDFARAGALGLAGTAALNTVDAVDPAEGETVLVSGATGGVGAYAVQLVAARGAVVIATAKPGREADFVRDLGAAHVVDYSGDLAAQVRAVAPEGMAAALHLAGDGAQLAGLLVDGGRIASTLGFSPEQTPRTGIVVTSVMANPDTPTLQRLAEAAAGGSLRVSISSSYSLDTMAQAFGQFGGGSLGKLAVTVD